jgi:hypothetical protein
MQSSHAVLAGAGVLAAGILVALAFTLGGGEEPTRPPSAPESRPQVPLSREQEILRAVVATQSLGQKVLTNQKSPRPLHVKSKYPPRTKIPITKLPPVDRGIVMPDGTRLPFLNGMTWAPEAPPRPREIPGPTAPVVALYVDDEGFEWWLHADGCATTSRYKQVTANGETYWDPATDHNVPKPNTQVLPTDGSAPPPSQGK